MQRKGFSEIKIIEALSLCLSSSNFVNLEVSVARVTDLCSYATTMLDETMTQMNFTNFNFKLATTLILICLSFSATLAQDDAKSQQPAAKDTAKAEEILKRAVEVLGGSNYLNVRTVVGRGQFTQYKDGVPTVPSSFVDYIVLPDKERTEFRGSNLRVIQTNTGERGWIYDGAARTLKDMTPAQVEDFKITMRVSVDNFLRSDWRKQGAQISYAGRREAGLARRNEVVRVTYPDGFTVDFEFSARDGLPVKVVYKKKNSEGEETAEEDRLLQYLTINGIQTPFVIDHYSEGVQTARVNYQQVEFNRPVPDSLFARPASVKDVKM